MRKSIQFHWLPLPGRAGLLTVMAAVAAVLALLLNLGFRLAGDPAPSALSGTAAMAALVLGIIVSSRLRATVRPRPEESAPVMPARPGPVFGAVSALASPALCAHLGPIEQAMRQDGVAVRRQQEARFESDCRVDLPGLAARFGAAAAALYIERHEVDRSMLDPKTALFWCSQCRASLRVVHPDEASEHTPVFPSDKLESADDLKATAQLQARVIQGLRAGKRFSTAHKEGGTHVFFNGRVFVRSDYGEWNTQNAYATDSAVLEFLRTFFDWEARRDTQLSQASERQVWAYILSRLGR